MKKMLIAVIILLTLSACTSSVSAPKTDVPQSTTATSEVELVFSSFRQGNTVLYYPRVQGLSDLKRQDGINEAILKDAKNVIALFGDDVVCITIDYEVVARSDEKLVIEYTGHGCTTPTCDREETVSYVSEIYL